MAFWKKKTASDEGPSELGEGIDGVESELDAQAGLEAGQAVAVLDTIGSALRAIEEFPMETETLGLDEVTRLCDQWARHALTGAAAPGEEGAGSDVDPGGVAALPLGERQWRSLGRFFKHHRRSEFRKTQAVMGELKGLIWNFANTLRGTVVADDVSDRRVSHELMALHKAADQGSLDELRNQVKQTVAVVSEAISHRQARYEQHLHELGEQLSTMRIELLEARRKMEHDALTAVFNRGAFDVALERYVNLSFFSGQPLTLLLVDLDHFKALNDTHGHRAGDAVLKKVASQLVRAFPRRSDFVARYGGEEFVVLLLDTDLQHGGRLVDRFLEGLRRLSVEHDGTVLQVTASVGVATIVRGESAEEFLERADKALYQAKEGGRNQAVAA